MQNFGLPPYIYPDPYEIQQGKGKMKQIDIDVSPPASFINLTLMKTTLGPNGVI